LEFQDYYKVLGVDRDASQDEIKRAYRKLAQKYHPDRNKDPDAQQTFARVGEAYEVLKDPEKRKQYDRFGQNWKQGQEFDPGQFGFEGGRARGGGGRSFEFRGGESGDFSDFFRMAFGGRGGQTREFEQTFGGGPQTQQRRRHKGQTHEAQVRIGLEEAYHGATRQISVQGADGRARTLDVRIPPGTTDGSRIRLAGQGGPGIGGGEPGDLLLDVRIAPHPTYRVKGHDLAVTLELAPWEAALGAKVEVPTLDGPVTLNVPAGTPGGQKLRLKEKGLHRRKAGGRGNLYARTRIVVPEELSDKEKELFEQLSEASDFNPRQ
jgi:curved DNA-binding protein